MNVSVEVAGDRLRIYSGGRFAGEGESTARFSGVYAGSRLLQSVNRGFILDKIPLYGIIHAPLGRLN